MSTCTYGTAHENDLTAGEIKSRQFRDADGVLCHLAEDIGNGYWRYYHMAHETEEPDCRDLGQFQPPYIRA